MQVDVLSEMRPNTHFAYGWGGADIADYHMMMIGAIVIKIVNSME